MGQSVVADFCPIYSENEDRRSEQTCTKEPRIERGMPLAAYTYVELLGKRKLSKKRLVSSKQKEGKDPNRSHFKITTMGKYSHLALLGRAHPWRIVGVCQMLYSRLTWNTPVAAEEDMLANGSPC